MADDRFKVSWSSLQRFEQCKAKDYLVRQKLANPHKDVRNFLAGNVVDSIQKSWLENPSLDMLSMVDQHMDLAIEASEKSGSIKWRNKNDKAGIKSFCKDVVVQLQPILEARVLPYNYEPAVRFYSPIRIRRPSGEAEEIILRGEFDLLVQDPEDGKYIVWDLKTTKDNDYWKKTLGQLVFYDLVIISMFGQPPKKTGLIQPACDEQIKEFFFTKEDRADMWARITAMMESEWAGDHRPKSDSIGCSWCEVSHACPKFNRKWIG